jgi:ferredoxin
MPIRIILSQDRCRGHAQCEMFAPDVFEVTEDAVVSLKVEVADDSLRAELEEAVRHCPESVISLQNI